MRSVWRIWLECRLYTAGKGEDPRLKYSRLKYNLTDSSMNGCDIIDIDDAGDNIDKVGDCSEVIVTQHGNNNNILD